MKVSFHLKQIPTCLFINTRYKMILMTFRNLLLLNAPNPWSSTVKCYLYCRICVAAKRPRTRGRTQGVPAGGTSAKRREITTPTGAPHPGRYVAFSNIIKHSLVIY